jgi:hypothetical protein
LTAGTRVPAGSVIGHRASGPPADAGHQVYGPSNVGPAATRARGSNRRRDIMDSSEETASEDGHSTSEEYPPVSRVTSSGSGGGAAIRTRGRSREDIIIIEDSPEPMPEPEPEVRREREPSTQRSKKPSGGSSPVKRKPVGGSSRRRKGR